MLAKINLDKEKVLRFFNIKSIPSISNGFKVIEHKGNFYITGKGNHAPIHVHNQIELAFMKSNCPRVTLTTNCWTSVQNLSYMTLPAHFIDND